MITVERCSCGHDACRYYWLVGVGSFVQGSGFSREEAQQIADLLNAAPREMVVPDTAGLRSGDYVRVIRNGPHGQTSVLGRINHLSKDGTFDVRASHDGRYYGARAGDIVLRE